uniref:DUF659 domain-containing protein n=1 Tax=Phaseolus vulgaris TaxID=3885 RepID=V7CK89_PHAVU|nr:hypothetical protein PHAVU_002G060400g [Phaseolus vulgaris]ESW29316.1 hypothetical protein PHAVU_002G060400g [Phaseolus vulgaris]
MVRGRDPCWEHCVLVDATKQKVRCVYRMNHLAQIKNKDIVPCTEVPTDVRDHIQSILSAPKKPKTPKKQKAYQAAISNGQQNSSSASGGLHHSHGYSGQDGIACPSLLFPHPSPCAQPIVDDGKKQKQDDADRKLAIFFFHNSIPLSAAKSMYYQEMVDAIAQCGVGYKAPTYEKLRSTLLEKVKADIHNDYKKYRDEWKETGCTVLCDNWSDGRIGSLAVFSVACPKGTLFLKSVDVSGHEDDSIYLFELLESVVLEVGLENVVQFIFWSPCVAYCIDKMLEDIGRQDWVSTVLEDAKTITQYIYSHPWILNIMRKFTGGKELIRPKITRFVTDFLSLRSIVMQEDNLKKMFSHSEWLSSMYSRRPDAQAIKSLLYSIDFGSMRMKLSVSEPLVKFLRMVDGDMPAMDLRMRNGFQEAMLRLATTDKEKMEITKELPTYINAQGALGTDFAVLGRTLNAPGMALVQQLNTFHCDWWTSYGYEIPTLQKAAMRILSQPCSSLWEAKSGPIIFDEIDCSCEWPSEIESLPPLMDDSWLDDLPLQCRGSP